VVIALAKKYQQMGIAQRYLPVYLCTVTNVGFRHSDRLVTVKKISGIIATEIFFCY
jgi:hypothetical protein